MTLAPLAPAERERLLALIGIERWVLRDCGSDLGPIRGRLPNGDPAASRSEPAPRGRDAVEPQSRPGSLPQEASPTVRPARLAIVTGEADPLSGRHAALLCHVLRALALDDAAVAWEAREGVPVLAFGAAPGDAPDAVLAPPLATLRASGAARRALWPALRALRRRFREGR